MAVTTAGNTFPDGTPLPTALPLDGRQQSAASAAVPSLQAGEQLHVAVEAEVTDDVVVQSQGSYRPVNVPVTSELVLASTPQATTGTVLAPAAGGMVDWRQHHAGIVRDATYVVPASLAGQSLYVNLVLSSAASPAPRQCFAYDDRLGQFTPAEGCMLHIENDDHLVDVSVLRMPPPAGAGYTVQLVGGGGAVTTDLPVPDPGAPLYGQQRVVWSSGPIDPLRRGDTLEVSVQLHASILGLVSGMPAVDSATTGCNVMLAGRLYLSPYPDRLPAAGDPAGNAVPSLDDGYSFNLTQSQPETMATWHAQWTADSEYVNSVTPNRYVVLAVWASASSGCQQAIQASGQVLGPATGLHVDAAESSGSVLRFSPSTESSWGEGVSTAGANSSLSSGTAARPTVLSVVPVRLTGGELLDVSAEAAFEASSDGEGGLQLVVGNTYDGTQDTGGTPITGLGSSAFDPGSDRAVMSVRGALSAGAVDPSGAVSYVKLIGWSDAAGGTTIDPVATSLTVRLLSPSGPPSTSDLPAPPATLIAPPPVTPSPVTPPPATSSPGPPATSAPPAPIVARPQPSVPSQPPRSPITEQPAHAHPASHGSRPRRHPTRGSTGHRSSPPSRGAPHSRAGRSRKRPAIKKRPTRARSAARAISRPGLLKPM